MALVQAYSGVFTVAMIILALLAILMLVRAVIGPTIADRVVAVNMMGTMVIVIIAILAVRMGEGYLVDICLIYAMISFLAVVVLTKMYTGVYLEGKKEEKANVRKREDAKEIKAEIREIEKEARAFEKEAKALAQEVREEGPGEIEKEAATLVKETREMGQRVRQVEQEALRIEQAKANDPKRDEQQARAGRNRKKGARKHGNS